MWYCLVGSAVAGALGALAYTHLGPKPSYCKPKSTPKKFHLKYWNGRGLMEVPRTMLALKGVEFVDGRYTTDAPYDNVKSLKEVEDTLDCNLGRMPAITVDGQTHIGQSAAINYYIAAELGMMGSSNEEAAKILSIREHLIELKKAQGWEYFVAPTEEQLDAFFNKGPSSSSGPADMKTRKERAMPFYLARLEKIVGSNGFAVGDDFTLADALIYNMFGENLKDFEAAEKVKQHLKEPCASSKRTAEALAKHPNIKKIVDNYGQAISGYLASRGVQRF